MRTGDSRRAARTLAAASLGLVTAACAAACGGDELPAGQVTPEVTTMLEHLPGDAFTVVGIRADRARAVPALARLIEWMPAAPVGQTIAENCGLDPRRGVDLAVATLGGAGGGDSVFVAMKGSFTRESLATCIIDLADRTRQPLPVTQDGSVLVYGTRGASGHLYWPTRDVAIAAPLARDAAGALNALVGKAGVRTESRLMSYVSRVRTGAAFWMAGPLPPALHQQMAGLGSGVPAMQGFYASADGEGGGRVRALLGFRLAGKREAATAARIFREQRGALAAAAADPRAAAVVNRLELLQSGSDVVLQASLDSTEAALFIDLVAGMTGLPAAGTRP